MQLNIIGNGLRNILLYIFNIFASGPHWRKSSAG